MSCELSAAASELSSVDVERHRHNVLDKLDMRDRVQLTRYAARRSSVRARGVRARWGELRRRLAAP